MYFVPHCVVSVAPVALNQYNCRRLSPSQLPTLQCQSRDSHQLVTSFVIPGGWKQRTGCVSTASECAWSRDVYQAGKVRRWERQESYRFRELREPRRPRATSKSLHKRSRAGDAALATGVRVIRRFAGAVTERKRRGEGGTVSGATRGAVVDCCCEPLAPSTSTGKVHWAESMCHPPGSVLLLCSSHFSVRRHPPSLPGFDSSLPSAR